MNDERTVPTPLGNLPDEDLMLMIAQGIITQPVAELFDRHNHALFNFIAWLCQGNLAEAEDICQKTWIKLMQYSGEYKPTAAFRTFLYQIARNALIDAKRSAYDQRRETLEEGALTDPEHDITPEAELRLKQNMHQVREAILCLPAPQREVIVLRFFNDMSLQEIADIADIGFETVKSRLRYAFAHLRRELERAS